MASYKNIKLEERSNANVKKFQLGEEPEIIYVIRTGFENNTPLAYMIVYEDAYEINLGKTAFMSPEELEKTFGIGPFEVKESTTHPHHR